jgi:hypothetical protein
MKLGPADGFRAVSRDASTALKSEEAEGVAFGFKLESG